VASKGGFGSKIDDAAGDTPVTVSLNFIEDASFGWQFVEAVAGMSAEFDSDVTRTGRLTLKLEATDATGRGNVRILDSNTDPFVGSKDLLIPVKPSTKYRLGIWAKTKDVPADSVWIRGVLWHSDFTSQTNFDSNKLTGDNDWTWIETVFTTDSLDGWMGIILFDNVAGAANEAWFDVNALVLEELVDITHTGVNIFPAVTAVKGESLGLIQQEATVDNASVNLGLLAGVEKLGQSFVATDERLQGMTFRRETNIGTYVGDVIVTIEGDSAGDPDGVALVSRTYLNAEWNALPTLTDIFTELPTLLTVGTTYHLVFDSTTQDASNHARLRRDASTGTGLKRFTGASWVVIATSALYFRATYNELSEDVNIDINGASTFLDKQLLNSETFDIENGEFSYFNTFGDHVDILDLHEVSDPTFIQWLSVTSRLQIAGANQFATFKFDIVNGAGIATLVSTSVDEDKLKLQYSFDNVNWVDLNAFGGAQNQAVNHQFDVTGQSVVYIRILHDGTGQDRELNDIRFNCPVDTTGFVRGDVYTTGVDNSFADVIVTAQDVTRVHYRQNKYEHPSFELTDGSDVFIQTITLPLDNSQETTPVVKITELNGVAAASLSGTGGLVSGKFELNDGEYVTVGTPSANIAIDYDIQVANNILRISTNEGSHQANVVYQGKVQGALFSIQDMRKDIQALQKNIGRDLEGLRVTKVATGDYTITKDDELVLYDGIAQPVTFTFANNAFQEGKRYEIKDISGNVTCPTNILTIATEGNQSIDAVPSVTILVSFGSIAFKVVGGNLFIMP